MRYSFVLGILWALGDIPTALWCYFVHSWCGWKELKGDAYIYKCQYCGRYWHEQYYDDDIW